MLSRSCWRHRLKMEPKVSSTVAGLGVADQQHLVTLCKLLNLPWVRLLVKRTILKPFCPRLANKYLSQTFRVSYATAMGAFAKQTLNDITICLLYPFCLAIFDRRGKKYMCMIDHRSMHSIWLCFIRHQMPKDEVDQYELSLDKATHRAKGGFPFAKLPRRFQQFRLRKILTSVRLNTDPRSFHKHIFRTFRTYGYVNFCQPFHSWFVHGAFPNAFVTLPLTFANSFLAQPFEKRYPWKSWKLLKLTQIDPK